MTFAADEFVNVKISYSRTGPLPTGCEGARTGIIVTPLRVRPYDGRMEYDTPAIAVLRAVCSASMATWLSDSTKPVKSEGTATLVTGTVMIGAGKFPHVLQDDVMFMFTFVVLGATGALLQSMET